VRVAQDLDQNGITWPHASPSLYRNCLCLEYLEIERVAREYLDVKEFAVTMRAMASTRERDHIDRFLARLENLGHPDIDLEVEGIVDRISSINKRIKKGMETILAEHDLTWPEWHVMSRLRLRADNRSSPGELAEDLEISSGAMTSRLDRLERQGFVRRLPDPEDRRGIVVELTPAGMEAWDRAAGIAGRREAFFASALTKDEQRKLNALLRKLLVALESRE
jgi:DNA-binding MarR family transcriptional regulator